MDLPPVRLPSEISSALEVSRDLPGDLVTGLLETAIDKLTEMYGEPMGTLVSAAKVVDEINEIGEQAVGRTFLHLTYFGHLVAIYCGDEELWDNDEWRTSASTPTEEHIKTEVLRALVRIEADHDLFTVALKQRKLIEEER